MSDRDIYQPHVYINGVKLSETAALHGLTPVADLVINWGGRDWFGDVDPSTASLLILDPYGALLTLEKGAQVLITADPDNRVMFRGTLDTSRATFTKRSTARGHTVELWEVEVEATDPLTGLATDRDHGPAYTARNGQVNRLHWGLSSIIERFYDVQARCRTPIVWRYQAWMKLIDATWPPQGDFPVLPYTLEQNVSVLTVLRRTARIEHPLNRPFYDHVTGKIRLLKPPTANALPVKNATLTVSGGKLVLDRTVSTVAATELDGAHLVADGGKIALELKEYERTNRAILKSSYPVSRPADTAAGIYGSHFEVRESANPVSINAGMRDGSTVEIETDFVFTQNENIPVGIYAGIGTTMAAIDGWRQPPKFSFNVRDHAVLPAALAALFRASPAFNDATDVITALTIVGSPLQWAGTMPSFAVVGGELRYTDRNGWQVTCIPATVPTQRTTGTTLGDITRTEPISTFADRYMVCDLHTL